MRIQALALLAALTLPLPLLADTITYTYSGNDFTKNDSPYTTSDTVTGEFTLSAPLADNLGTSMSLVTIDPASFSFSDGVDTLSNANATIRIDIGTNASGAIDEWDISMQNGGPPGLEEIVTENFNVFIADQAINDLDGADDFNENSPGAWTSSTTVTPEPASLMLVGTALLGTLGFARREILTHRSL